jgi:hypothetical protein
MVYSHRNSVVGVVVSETSVADGGLARINLALQGDSAMDYFRDFLSSPLPQPDPYQRASQQLNVGDAIFSATRAFKVVIETSGLVLYTIDDATLPADITQGQYNQIWSSTPAPAAVVRCNMQADGNLVAYDNGGYPVWATGTQGFPGAFFRCQDDGNLVLISQDGVVRKHSDTYAGPR